MADAAGETKEPLRVAFDRRLKLEFHGSWITSDGGLLAYRELDDVLGLTALAALVLGEGRSGRRTSTTICWACLRQSVYGRLAGYEDVNDAERLARDPVMRAIVGREGIDRPAASTSQMGRFETEWLACEANLAAPRTCPAPGSTGCMGGDRQTDHPRHGQLREPDPWPAGGLGLERALRLTCSHPLFVFNQFGDLERCLLRPGNAHSAEGWRTVLEPVIARYRERGLPIWFRGDAAFAKPELYELLEAEGIGYAIRMPANTVLQERIGHLLTRPVGRPPNKPQVSFASFSYQAQSWSKSRRVVATVEWHQGELYPRVGFIVTNLKRPAERISKFYNGRGTAEQWIREGKYALRWTRRSCREEVVEIRRHRSEGHRRRHQAAKSRSVGERSRVCQPSTRRHGDLTGRQTAHQKTASRQISAQGTGTASSFSA